MACTKRLLLGKEWQIMLLRYLCGEAKFEWELFIISICISNLEHFNRCVNISNHQANKLSVF